MEFSITKEHVWVAAVPDRPGGLAEKLRELRDTGLNLELIVGQRDLPGRALLTISPLRSTKDIKTVEDLGFSRENSMRTIRVVGPNLPGLGAAITACLANADINIRGFTAAVLSDNHVTNIAFDHNEDADQAAGWRHAGRDTQADTTCAS